MSMDNEEELAMATKCTNISVRYSLSGITAHNGALMSMLLLRVIYVTIEAP